LNDVEFIKMKIVLLTGGPGSGKSTQSLALSARNAKFQHISLGEVVRARLNDPEHPISPEYQVMMNEGKLLPDDFILSILEKEIAQIKDKDSVLLLDGYPRTEAQYELFKTKWGMPDALIHLDADERLLSQRLHSRNNQRADDNQAAVNHRLDFYQHTTKPMIDHIKADLKKNAITLTTDKEMNKTNLFLYTQLERISGIQEVLNQEQQSPEKSITNPALKSISRFSILSQAWETGLDEYAAIEALQKKHHTNNFSFSLLGKPIVYLETPQEVKTVLDAKSSLGQVYRQFSLAAGLKHDFVATDAHDPNSYRLDDNKVNMWKLVHTSLNQALKDDKKGIEQLIDKHLNQTFLAQKSFDLDTTFDTFFTAFWSEYLLGEHIAVDSYQENRHTILTAMKHSFYSNKYKAIDPSGLSSLFYSYAVSNPLGKAKEKINEFISKSTPNSMVQRFKSALEALNISEHLDLDKQTIDEIVADNVFDLFFEPDFLENVIYEALVSAIRDNANLREPAARKKVYDEGMHQGYLFPIRARVLEEPVNLMDGSELPAGSTVYLNMKQSGLYHSSGARRCVGQAYTHYFKEHLFNRLQSIEFKVKAISYPAERQSADKNVPVSPERYQVSWHLKRDEAMQHLPSHNYKGNRFFDVLSLYKHPSLNSQIVKQLVFKINRCLQKDHVDLNDVVIVTSEVRGIPMAAQVADHLQLPLYIIRKKGGYKMSSDEVYCEAYDKGYGDPDEVELPINQVQSLAGKKIIFLDDGLASGNSALACINLLEKNRKPEPTAKPAEVIMVMALLKHDYIKTEPKLSEHRLVKTLFDCHSKAPELRETPIAIKGRTA
jgi:adenylate kinase family enzyme/adenine/guanine phosphoribosyltransferase-like PRPP-binding protein